MDNKNRKKSSDFYRIYDSTNGLCNIFINVGQFITDHYHVIYGKIKTYFYTQINLYKFINFLKSRKKTKKKLIKYKSFKNLLSGFWKCIDRRVINKFNNEPIEPIDNKYRLSSFAIFELSILFINDCIVHYLRCEMSHFNNYDRS